MNKTRAEIKWSPFESLFHAQDITKEIATEKAKRTKPILSEEQKNENEKRLLRAYHTQEEIQISYFYKGFIYQKKTYIIYINSTQKAIYLADHTTLYFDQIIHLTLP